MEYFGRAKSATEATKIANAKEEIQLEILEEISRANSENNEFKYDNVWNNLNKKDSNLQHEWNSDKNAYDVIYKGYEFLINSNNEVIYVGEFQPTPSQTSTELVPLGSVTIDGITYTESYEIWNKNQLENLRDRVNNGEDFANCIFWQKADINLNSTNWVPIANDTSVCFSGRYNGEKHTIKELNINTSNSVQGLFGEVYGYTEQQYAIIENLTVEGNVTGSFMCGGIAGRTAYATIRNCINKVNVTSTSRHGTESYTGNLSSTGGIVGRIALEGGDIINCQNYGTITGNYGAIGGIVGWNRKGNITGCENHSEIINSSVPDVGGIVGWMEEGSIEKCYNTKKIEGKNETGGICGCVGYSYNGTNKIVSISKVKNIGEVSGGVAVGGISGTMVNSSIEQASNNGYVHSNAVNSNNFSNVGGIVGNVKVNSILTNSGKSPISYCYNTGNIEALSRGVAGIAGTYGGANISINNCYNIGDIKNTNTQGYTGKTGGIWGYLENVVVNEATNCWQLKDCIKEGADTDQVNIEEKTEAEIKALDWDNYVIVAGKNNEYPILTWENE